MDAQEERRPDGRSDEPPLWARELLLRLDAVEHRTRTLASTVTPSTPLEQGPSGDSSGTGPEDAQGLESQFAERLLESLQLKSRKHRLPDPERFEGRKSEFKAWTAQMWAKLSVDMENDSLRVRFWYAHSRLGGSALNQITPWVAALIASTVEIDADALSGLMGQLANAYDDPENAERAIEKLNTLKQGKRPFAKYLATFERTLLEAGGLTWDVAVKKAMLAKGLSRDVKKALVATPTPASYEEYCATLHRVTHNLESLHRMDNTAPETKATDRTDDKMEWEPTKETRIATTKKELRNDSKKSRKHTIQFRGKCYSCGKEGHIERNCPNNSDSSAAPAPKKRTQVASTKTAKKDRGSKSKKVKNEVSSEEETDARTTTPGESGSDSGKE